MTTADLLTVAAVCLMGAMSPGPSLAIVLRHALTSGRVVGFLAATTHALAIGIYALATALGMALLLSQAPSVSVALQVLGGGFLLYLGGGMLRTAREASSFAVERAPADGRGWRALRDGFLVAFLNPKIMLFFAAVFSPFVRAEAELAEKLSLAGVAFLVDWIWFVFIVALVSQHIVVLFVRRHGWLMDRVFGVLLVGYGVQLLGASMGFW